MPCLPAGASYELVADLCPCVLPAAILYVLSCLAKQPDMRAELEAAGAVPVLLDLLASITDTQVQVCACFGLLDPASTANSGVFTLQSA